MAHQARVYDTRTIGSRPGATAGRIGVVAALLPERRVVGQHRIHRAGGHAGEESGTPHALDVPQPVPSGLGHDAHPQPVGAQPTSKQRHAERRMVHVRVPCDQENVQFPPATAVHLLARHGQGILAKPGRAGRGLPRFPTRRHAPTLRIWGHREGLPMIGTASGRTVARISGHVKRCSRNGLVAAPRARIAIVCKRCAAEAYPCTHANPKIQMEKAAGLRGPLSPHRQ